MWRASFKQLYYSFTRRTKANFIIQSFLSSNTDNVILIVFCDLAKSKFRHEVHLYNNRGHHKAADSYFHGLGQTKAFEMVQFH